MTVCDFDRLPPPYPGELWYSLLARDVRNRGVWHGPQRLCALLGSLPARVNIAFPNRIGSLLRYQSPFNCRDEVTFARQHTLLPYYLAFEPASWMAQMLAASSEHDVPLSKAMGQFTPQWLPTRLRYCRSCHEEAVSIHGEQYWHTIHQLPFVTTCDRHREPLFESTVPYAPARHEFLTAHRSRCPDRARTSPPATLSPSMAEALSIASLRANRGALADCHLDSAGYASALSACGFAGTRGRVASQQLDTAVQSFLGFHATWLAKVQQRPWWRLTYTAIRGRLWPVQHMAMRLFIRQALLTSPHLRGRTSEIDTLLLGSAT